MVQNGSKGPDPAGYQSGCLSINRLIVLCTVAGPLVVIRIRCIPRCLMGLGSEGARPAAGHVCVGHFLKEMVLEY